MRNHKKNDCSTVISDSGTTKYKTSEKERARVQKWRLMNTEKVKLRQKIYNDSHKEKHREPILKPTKEYQNYLDSIKGLESGNLEIGYQNYKNKTQSTTEYEAVVDWTQCGCDCEFEPGIVLDPFFGAGTCGVAAEMLGLNWIGIELKEEYTKIARKRLEPYMMERLV